MTDKEFFDAPSPLGDRDTRREAINDYAGNIMAECEDLKFAVAENNLDEAREHFKELKEWLDALDDNLCKREKDGSRKG